MTGPRRSAARILVGMGTAGDSSAVRALCRDGGTGRGFGLLGGTISGFLRRLVKEIVRLGPEGGQAVGTPTGGQWRVGGTLVPKGY